MAYSGIYVGDTVRNVKSDSDRFGLEAEVISVVAGTVHVVYASGAKGVDGGGDYYEKINNKDTIMSTLKQKVALVFKNEPERSFIKAGVLNIDETFTEEGRDTFLAFLLKKNGDAFKTEVIDPILAEEENTK